MTRDLADLIARVEGASGSDREIDVRVWQALLPDHVVVLDQGKAFGPGPKRAAVRGPISEFDLEGWQADAWPQLALQFGVRPITASIDAALALVERCLPGWHYALRQRVYRQPPVYECELQCWRETEYGVAPSAPLAILLALLRALQSQEPSDA